MDQTYWNGELTPCKKVKIKVGTSLRPTWWCAGLEGTIRKAVQVSYHGQVFYLDNEDGSGWAKVTTGRGGPRTSHLSLPDNSEVQV